MDLENIMPTAKKPDTKDHILRYFRSHEISGRGNSVERRSVVA